MLKIKQFVFNPFGVNTYVVWDDATRLAMVVDPGMTDVGERALFDSYISDNGLKLTQVVNTHMHLDHCFGDNYVRDKYGVKVAASEYDAPLGASINEQLRMFGVNMPGDHNVAIDVNLAEGDTVGLGEYSFEVIEVPGHSEGGLVLYCEKAGIAFVGDSLFAGAIGRTDLPGGDYNSLINALKEKVLTLPLDTRLFPGHDRATTVAAEAASNPYLR